VALTGAAEAANELAVPIMPKPSAKSVAIMMARILLSLGPVGCREILRQKFTNSTNAA
jgi:hypothetical protein